MVLQVLQEHQVLQELAEHQVLQELVEHQELAEHQVQAVQQVLQD